MSAAFSPLCSVEREGPDGGRTHTGGERSDYERDEPSSASETRRDPGVCVGGGVEPSVMRLSHSSCSRQSQGSRQREREGGVELPLDGVVEDDLTQHHSQQQIFPVGSHELLEASQESRLVL
jgi:hypothetical protein